MQKNKINFNEEKKRTLAYIKATLVTNFNQHRAKKKSCFCKMNLSKNIKFKETKMLREKKPFRLLN